MHKLHNVRHIYIFNILVLSQQLCSQIYHTLGTNGLYSQFATLINNCTQWGKNVMRLKYRAMRLLIISFKTVPNGLNTCITAFIRTSWTLGKLIFDHRFFWISMTVSKWLVPSDDGFQEAMITISCLHKISAGNKSSKFCIDQANWGTNFSPTLVCVVITNPLICHSILLHFPPFWVKLGSGLWWSSLPSENA